jgi:predicted transcriptional regulator of viral defense system
MPADTRAALAKLSRVAHGGLISVAEASEALGVPRGRAAKTLASLAARNWLRRVRRGLYLVAPLETEPGRKAIPEDSWLLAQAVFAPCYIGGWSAAEHWGLTEQIFRSTLVITASPVRGSRAELLGHEYRLFKVPPSRIAGSLASVWRGAERMLVSTPERTLADCLRNPELAGGIRPLADLFAEYWSRSDRDVKKLLAAMEQVASGAAWKRLGYLAERLFPGDPPLVIEARRHRTAGYTRLDPAVRRRGKLIRRWGLWVNADIGLLPASE